MRTTAIALIVFFAASPSSAWAHGLEGCPAEHGGATMESHCESMVCCGMAAPISPADGALAKLRPMTVDTGPIPPPPIAISPPPGADPSSSTSLFTSRTSPVQRC